MASHEIELLHLIRPEHRDRIHRLIDTGIPMTDAALQDAIFTSFDSRYVSWLPDDADVARFLRDYALGRDGCRGHAHVISSVADLDQTDTSIGGAVRLVESTDAGRSIISCIPGRVAYLRDGTAKQHALLLRLNESRDPPSPDEARQAIASAFADFKLRRTMGAYEAAAIEDYVMEPELEEYRREDAPFAELHWSELPRDYVVVAGGVMHFLDDESLCAFLPAFLTFLPDTTFGRHWDRDSGMIEWIEHDFWETRKGRLLTPEQRQAALKYLEYEGAYGDYEESECVSVESDSPPLVSMWKALMRECGDDIP